MGIVRLEEASVEFGDVRAVDSVTLEVDSRECLAIIGPNGAGKTTLLRVIAGLQWPDRGRVYVRGELIDQAGLPTLRSKTTMVFQKPVLFGTTVFKNVAYPLRQRGIEERIVRRRVAEILALLGLQELQDRYARNLSGGEQKRVAIGMALATDPEVLILDEPTAYLDAHGTMVVEELLRRLQRDQSVAVVIATHDILQVSRLADRIAIMEHGRLEDTGRSLEVLRAGLEEIVMREGPCNVFNGTVVDGRDHGGLRLAEVRLTDDLTIEAITNRTGEVTIRIPPEDLIVSTQPVLSSARNRLQGSIEDIVVEDDTLVRLTVDVGVPLTAVITRDSRDRLRIERGDRVYVTFKASSVRVY